MRFMFGASGGLLGLALILTAVAGLWIALSAGAWDGTADVKAEQMGLREAGARRACRDWISALLHDPASARWDSGHFGHWRDWSADGDGYGRVVVHPRFRVENPGGELVVSMWRCEAQAVGDGWRLVALNRT